MRIERIRVGGLARLGVRLLPNTSSEVVDPHEQLIRAKEARDQSLQIQPVVAAPVLLPKTVVEVEAVNVGLDALHAHG
jgi:hypothetical protein